MVIVFIKNSTPRRYGDVVLTAIAKLPFGCILVFVGLRGGCPNWAIIEHGNYVRSSAVNWKNTLIRADGIEPNLEFGRSFSIGQLLCFFFVV